MKIFTVISAIVCLLIGASTYAQETMNADTSVTVQIRRPHILYVEALGRGGYWSVGYGYSFFQRNSHELNSIIGVNFMWYGKHRQSTMIPVGLFYRYGERFKVEIGFTVTPDINWARIYIGPYWNDHGEPREILNHDILFIPSIGFVYGSKNKRIEIGLRYTPAFTIRVDNALPVWFGVFFHYRLTQRKK